MVLRAAEAFCYTLEMHKAMKEVTKEQFKEIYFNLGGGAATGWGLEYWNKFFEDDKKPGMKYLLEEPETPEQSNP